MSVQSLNHYNLRVPKPLLAEFEQFYVDVLGFRAERFLRNGIQGFWLYAAGQPLVHVTQVETPPEPTNSSASARAHTSGIVDHVAFSCERLDNLLERLNRLDVSHTRHDFPELGFVQIVVHDPLGLKIELNFEQGSGPR
jgi:catechol 2,3-dioxygenase-like lactoylglutathione lyase family enzyme